jgi:sugar phosphate isomerase/epimerase
VNAKLVRKFDAYCWFVSTDFADGSGGHLDLTLSVRIGWRSRDPVDMWKWHYENNSKEAWGDMLRSVESVLVAAEENNLILAFEPESENVVNSASRARKFLNELWNPRLRIVIDPANLICPGGDQQEVLDESFALLGNAIAIPHAEDRSQDFQPCAAGKGILDFPYYLRCLKDIAFVGPLILHGLEEKRLSSRMSSSAEALMTTLDNSICRSLKSCIIRQHGAQRGKELFLY